MEYQNRQKQIVALQNGGGISGCKQFKEIVDNRPTYAIQRRMIHNIYGQENTIQRVCAVQGIVQNDCNCGLFCIRMAIEALGGVVEPAAYDAAAEANGSKVGEIFDFVTMEGIVNSLGYSAQRINFSNQAGLQKAIQQSGNLPTLIAFSNLSYKMSRGIPDHGSPIHTQRGHWSVIQSCRKGVLTMLNPNSGTSEKIRLNSMFKANQKMAGSGKPQFDWSGFADENYTSMEEIIGKYRLSPEKRNKITRSFVGGKSLRFNSMQRLDLAGYLVVISK